MSKFQVEFYENVNGEIPVEEFIKSLDKKMRAKVGSDISRVLYFFYFNRKIILTNGFIKKTNKTPRVELQRAKQYRDDYMTRYKNE